MSLDCSNISSSYEPSSFVTAFHSIPHVNIDLREVSSDFAVSLSYFEPVIIWACVPILICLCIFILLLVYFIFICCCCCCREKTNRPRTCKLSCAFVLSILFIFCLGLVGVLIYAEVSLNKNVESFTTNGQNVVNELTRVSASVDNYNGTLVSDSMSIVIAEISNSNGDGKDAVLASANLILEVNTDIDAALASISNGLDSVQYDSIINSVNNFENIRNWSTIGFLIAVGLLLILSCLLTICMKSVCITIILVIISIFTILIWIAAGGALASTIVLSDVCIDPDGLIRNQTNNEPIAREIVNYFISCEPSCRPSDINETDAALQRYQMVVNNVTDYISANVPGAMVPFDAVKNQITVADQIYNNVSTILNCNPSQGIKEYYNSILDSMCDQGQLFIVITFSVLSGLALSLFILICCLTAFDGLIINTSSVEDFDQDDIVAYDSERANSWAASPRRYSYNEPYSSNGRNRSDSNNSNERREMIQMNEATNSLPGYSDIGGRPVSGEYDHFDV
ncbi:PREDICTED: protein tweety homolog 2-like [Amphimedon queenslandica]|uniref:Protein tweety homolog n=1 Tax=Amphimedon queenslandica TaxID=400682 RepID=A0A1X7VTT9_AMPQE|nr:PREDICTED: protein tweety homolog 2-like [Amphimedon queenslandica]|eukprot:XP_019852251.1 PREDICTED: protein tweety homolog 2-like [Amphimedon queenslandica]